MQGKSLLALSGVYHIKERLFARFLRRHGMEKMSPAQSRILMALWEQDDIPVRQLALLTSLDKSTLSLSLSRMEQFGIIERKGDATDRRIVRVKLTEHGRVYHHACAAAINDLSQILYRNVDAQDAAVFIKVLGQVFNNLQNEEQLSGS